MTLSSTYPAQAGNEQLWLVERSWGGGRFYVVKAERLTGSYYYTGRKNYRGVATRQSLSSVVARFATEVEAVAFAKRLEDTWAQYSGPVVMAREAHKAAELARSEAIDALLSGTRQ